MFTLLCAISIQILKVFCKDRRLLLYMSRTLHLFGTDWCAMMVPIQVIRWYRMQCYGGTDSCATVVPIRRYCHLAALSYNIGPYKVTGYKGKYPKSSVLKKLEVDNRNIGDDYVNHCHWRGKRIPSIERRRYAELMLLFTP